MYHNHTYYDSFDTLGAKIGRFSLYNRALKFLEKSLIGPFSLEMQQNNISYGYLNVDYEVHN